MFGGGGGGWDPGGFNRNRCEGGKNEREREKGLRERKERRRVILWGIRQTGDSLKSYDSYEGPTFLANYGKVRPIVWKQKWVQPRTL